MVGVWRRVQSLAKHTPIHLLLKRDIILQLVSHLINANRHCQDHDIILAGFDFHAVDIPQAEPLLGNFGNLIPGFADRAWAYAQIVRENVANSSSDSSPESCSWAASR